MTFIGFPISALIYIIIFQKKESIFLKITY